jgi:hypothetical protein
LRYRQRTIVVEAFRLGFDTIPAWFTCNVGPDGSFGVATPHGVMHAVTGDYVILGPDGSPWPCKADFFEAVYEPAGGKP